MYLIAPRLMTFRSAIPGFLMTAMGQCAFSCGIPNKRGVAYYLSQMLDRVGTAFDMNKPLRPINHAGCEDEVHLSFLVTSRFPMAATETSSKVSFLIRGICTTIINDTIHFNKHGALALEHWHKSCQIRPEPDLS